MKNQKAHSVIGHWFIVIFSLMGIIHPLPSDVSARPANDDAIRQSETVVFAVIGDYGSGDQPAADVASLVKSWNPDFIVTTGDNNYPNGAAWSMDQNVGQYYHEFIYPYKGGYGPGATSKKFYPALGNHDWMSGSAKPYFEYFSFYNERGYYEFTQGPVHFFILDSDQSEPDGTTEASKQAKWLKNGLASSTAPFNIVVTHHPPFSSGRHGSTSYMQWPFESWGADAVLAGHDHLYERILIDGFPYFVNGMGGGSLYGFETVVPGSQSRFNQDYGAMRVEAGNTVIKFQAFTRTAALIDEYTISNVVPVVTSISPANDNPTNLPGVEYTVTFSEPVTGVDINDFILTSTNLNGAYVSSVGGTGNTYRVSIMTGTNDGALRLDLIDDDSILNAFSNKLGGRGPGNGNFTSESTYVIDRTAPRGTSIVRAGPSPTSSPSVDFTVTFSEEIFGLDSTDFVLYTGGINGAVIDNVNGAGSIYTVSVSTGSGDGILGLELRDNDGLADLAGNMIGGFGVADGNSLQGEAFTIDKTSPSVSSIARLGPSPSDEASVDFLVTFTEPVTGVDSGDFSLSTILSSGASIANIGGSDKSYTVKVNTGVGDDLIRLDLNDDDSIVDPAGNPLGGFGAGNGTYATGDTYTIDKTAPHVLSIVRAGQNPSNGTTVDFIATFSENVSGVDISDFIPTAPNINGAFISDVAGAGNSYLVSVTTGSGDGFIRLDLIDNDSIVNGFNNQLGDAGLENGNFSSGESYIIDKTSPIATSIIRAGVNPSGSTAVDFIVTFSEPVTGVDLLDFNPVTTDIIGASVIGVKNVDPFYIVTVNTGMGTGSLRLDMLDDDSIADLAGNRAGGAGASNGAFTNGEPFSIAKNSINFPAPSIHIWINKSPSNNPSPSLTWTGVRDAQAYELNIAMDRNFSGIVTSRILWNSQYMPGAPLPDGTYYWRVRAYSPDRLPGRFSRTQSFTIDTLPPPAPVQFHPPNNSMLSTKPSFLWETVDTAIGYQFEMDDNPDFTSPDWSELRREPRYQKARLPKGTYFWRVRARDGAENWSAWSNAFTFTVP